MLKDWLIFSSAFNNIDLRKYRFSILLIIIIFFTWLFLYQAKDLPYDDNVGSIFISFLISLMTTLTILWLAFKKREDFLTTCWNCSISDNQKLSG